MELTKKSIPNILTIARIVLSFPIALFLGWDYFYVPLFLFFVASSTDFMDGYFARKFNCESPMGKLLDPLADKILYLSILIVFTNLRYIPLLPVVIILVRELFALSIGSLAMTKKDSYIDIMPGKVKNFVQFSSAFLILYTKGNYYTDVIMWFVAIFTAGSAIYLYSKNLLEFNNAIFEKNKITLNLPNMLTICRLLLVLPTVISIKYEQNITSIILIFITLITDALDGYFARKFNQSTSLGALLDPLADKSLYLSALITFVYKGYVGPIPIMLILIRELFITGMRSSCLALGKCFPASKHGKYKMLLQSATVVSIIIFQRHFINNILIYLATAVTLMSGIAYMIDMMKYFKEKFNK